MRPEHVRAVRKYAMAYTHADFHATIGEEPDNLTSSLVYADWLEEQGHSEAAEVIRRHSQEAMRSPRSVNYQPAGPANPVMTPGQFGVIATFLGENHNSVILDQRRADDPSRIFTWRTDALSREDAVRLLRGLIGRTGAATNNFTRRLAGV